MSPVFVVTLLYISSCMCIDGNVQESVLIGKLSKNVYKVNNILCEICSFKVG